MLALPKKLSSSFLPVALALPIALSLPIALALLMTVAHAAAADLPPDVIFRIGTPDALAAEFGLSDQDYQGYRERFPDPIVYTVGQSAPTDWPFIHPAPHDNWAGGRAHPFTIRFDYDGPTTGTELFLHLGTADAHGSGRSQVVVSVNGQDLPAQQAPTGSTSLAHHPKMMGQAGALVFPIPAGAVTSGANTLTIRLEEQSWIVYDYVSLSTQPVPPKVQTEFDLLGAFREGPMAEVRRIVFAVRPAGLDEHWYANFGHFADSVDRLTYAPGGRLCVLDVETGEVETLLDDPEGTVRDPQVHYDGDRALFSYRPGTSRYFHLYEMDLADGALRQITDGLWDDIEPTYLADGRIIFVSSRGKRWVQCWLTRVATLYICDDDGENMRPLSANVEHDNTPWPLPDGRILYQRWEYVDRSQVDYHHLWTMNPDGTGQMAFYGNHHPGILMIDAKPVPDSPLVVASFSPGHGRTEHDGYVTLVDPRHGPDARQGARNISRGSNFRDPWAFSDSAFLAARGAELVLLDPSGREQVLHRLSREDIAARMECHEPRPLTARPRERVIPDRVDLEATTGQFALMDIYHGRAMEGVERGAIERLLILESLPKPINYTGGMDPLSYGGTFTLERVVGTVPVEPDGSAYFEAPALRPLIFVALDGRDMAVKRMASFTSVQPGEIAGCIGCHESRASTVVSGGQAQALLRAASAIEPVADAPEVLDFPRHIQPILDRLCADCHGYEATGRGGPRAGDVLLTGDHGPMFSHAYFTMTTRQLFKDNRNRTVSSHAPYSMGSAASPIFKKLDGSHHGVRATREELTRMRLWIDIGAPYPGTYGALGGGSIGGYFQNNQVNTDEKWPTTIRGAEVIERRCAECHHGGRTLPKSLSDEIDISFWRFEIDDPRLQFSRHIVFNLSEPEQSLMVLAPLARAAGGWARCADEFGHPAPVFADTDDPDYRALVAMAAAGQANLARIKRFDMPGFQPPGPYVREMKRYGVLPMDLADDAPVDPYATDRRYWESLWWTGAAP